MEDKGILKKRKIVLETARDKTNGIKLTVDSDAKDIRRNHGIPIKKDEV